jgi:hypothetical protein
VVGWANMYRIRRAKFMRRRELARTAVLRATELRANILKSCAAVEVL